MARTDDHLERKVQQLAAQGADPLRLEALESARLFKRSWVQMAEALLRVRQRRAYETWGYDDLYAYCDEELLIKRATVDKLTGSFTTIKRHAPAALAADGVEQPLPSLDSVSYFAQAVGDQPLRGKAKRVDDAPAEVVERLRQAVFEEQRPVSALRREFNDVLYAKSPQERALEAVQRARGQVERLSQALPEIEGLSSRRVAQVDRTLSELGEDLDRLLERLKGSAEGARRAS